MDLYTRITSTCFGLHRARRRLDILRHGTLSRGTIMSVARIHCGAKLTSGLSITRTGSICCDALTSVPTARSNVVRCVGTLTMLLKLCPRSIATTLRAKGPLPSCVRPMKINLPKRLLLQHPSMQITRHRIGTRTTLLKTSGAS